LGRQRLTLPFNSAYLLARLSPSPSNGWVHGIAFLLIIATGVLAPLAMALAVRGDPGWRPIAFVSVAASAFFVVFLLLPGQRHIPAGNRDAIRLDRSGCRTACNGATPLTSVGCDGDRWLCVSRRPADTVEST
jgi:MFS family permease